MKKTIPGLFYSMLIVFTLVCCVWMVVITFDDNGPNKPPPDPPSVELRFQVGAMISLKIGGYGQIVGVNTTRGNTTYSVRVNTVYGPKIVCLRDYELEIKP